MEKNLLSKSTCQLLLISILAIVPVGCATENEEKLQSNAETPEISAPNEEITQETNNEITEGSDQTGAENTETAIAPTEGLTFNLIAELKENETIVYFDFDSADLTNEAREKLQQVAGKLANTSNNVEILIQGHADERGSYEYNLQLGNDRAVAVKEFLTSLGVKADLLSTKSYGEKKPLVEGSHPEAWSQNRRVEFIILESSQANRTR